MCSACRFFGRFFSFLQQMKRELSSVSCFLSLLETYFAKGEQTRILMKCFFIGIKTQYGINSTAEIKPLRSLLLLSPTMLKLRVFSFLLFSTALRMNIHEHIMCCFSCFFIFVYSGYFSQSLILSFNRSCLIF